MPWLTIYLTIKDSSLCRQSKLQFLDKPRPTTRNWFEARVIAEVSLITRGIISKLHDLEKRRKKLESQ
jgi:hypothetical protein